MSFAIVSHAYSVLLDYPHGNYALLLNIILRAAIKSRAWMFAKSSLRPLNTYFMIVLMHQNPGQGDADEAERETIKCVHADEVAGHR